MATSKVQYSSQCSTSGLWGGLTIIFILKLLQVSWHCLCNCSVVVELRCFVTWLVCLRTVACSRMQFYAAKHIKKMAELLRKHDCTVFVFHSTRCEEVEPSKSVVIMLLSGLLTLIYMAVGLYDTHSFEWPFLLKFLYTKYWNNLYSKSKVLSLHICF